MNTPTPKIIQLLMSPNDSVWQGVLLGLGDDGATYHCQGDTWQLYIPPLELQDKATEQRDEYKAALQSADNHNHEIATKLEIVTEQRDEMTLRWELTNDSLFDKRALADRLAEECAKIRDVAERAIDYLDQSYRDGFSDEVSELRYELAAVNAKHTHPPSQDHE